MLVLGFVIGFFLFFLICSNDGEKFILPAIILTIAFVGTVIYQVSILENKDARIAQLEAACVSAGVARMEPIEVVKKSKFTWVTEPVLAEELTLATGCADVVK